MSYTVVAIPSKDDYVWKISSEKVPHLTLLSLGDNLDNLGRVTDFIGHAVDSMLCRFGLSVDHRDILGPDKADVLFFDKYYINRLQDFINALLKNKNIFIAYNSTLQYPTWTPHLTLGYPSSPAKPDDREYPISWVQFDRIALWINDYEGVEFPLGTWESDIAAMGSISQDKQFTPEEALAHFGIKGMRWGHRNAVNLVNSPSSTIHMPNHVFNDTSRTPKIPVDVNAERKRQSRKRLLIAGAAYAGVILVAHGPELIHTIVGNSLAKKAAAAGAKAAANLLADNMGIGSHKIIDLGYDVVTGKWG